MTRLENLHSLNGPSHVQIVFALTAVVVARVLAFQDVGVLRPPKPAGPEDQLQINSVRHYAVLGKESLSNATTRGSMYTVGIVSGPERRHDLADVLDCLSENTEWILRPRQNLLQSVVARNFIALDTVVALTSAVCLDRGVSQGIAAAVIAESMGKSSEPTHTIVGVQSSADEDDIMKQCLNNPALSLPANAKRFIRVHGGQHRSIGDKYVEVPSYEMYHNRSELFRALDFALEKNKERDTQTQRRDPNEGILVVNGIPFEHGMAVNVAGAEAIANASLPRVRAGPIGEMSTALNRLGAKALEATAGTKIDQLDSEKWDWTEIPLVFFVIVTALTGLENWFRTTSENREKLFQLSKALVDGDTKVLPSEKPLKEHNLLRPTWYVASRLPVKPRELSTLKSKFWIENVGLWVLLFGSFASLAVVMVKLVQSDFWLQSFLQVWEISVVTYGSRFVKPNDIDRFVKTNDNDNAYSGTLFYPGTAIVINARSTGSKWAYVTMAVLVACSIYIIFSTGKLWSRHPGARVTPMFGLMRPLGICNRLFSPLFAHNKHILDALGGKKGVVNLGDAEKSKRVRKAIRGLVWGHGQPWLLLQVLTDAKAVTELKKLINEDPSEEPDQQTESINYLAKFVDMCTAPPDASYTDGNEKTVDQEITADQ